MTSEFHRKSLTSRPCADFTIMYSSCMFTALAVELEHDKAGSSKKLRQGGTTFGCKSIAS